MKNYRESILRRALTEQHGQVLPWIAFMMVLFLGMGAFVLDIGHGYYCYHELQSATDAAALAGAQQLRNANPIATATAYGAVSGSLNTNPNLTLGGINSVSMVPGYPLLKCLNAITAMGISCTAPNNANAIQVKEQAIVPTFFARVFGISQMTLSSTATAAVSGAKGIPYNVAIIIDTTRSMTDVDSNCDGGAERITCAESGVAVLLQNLYPCNIALGCGTVTNGIAANALDSVSIFTFPPVTNGTLSDDYNCSGTSPTIVPYTLPDPGSSTYAPTGSGTGNYQITSFQSSYKSSDSTTTLTGSSDVAMAVGSGTSSGSSCPGMAAPGGDGTYYAGVIYAAQAALTAQAAAETAVNPNQTVKNIMIILTDGEANASASKMATSTTGGTAIATSNTFPAGAGATSSLTNYPSPYDQCQQAVAAANYAKSQGTTIYAVAYGSESSGCTTDTTGPQANITPCQVMAEMASSTSTFYSDYNQSGSSSTCVSTGTSVTDMNDIFTNISADFLEARLIPNGTT
jgi:Flp pilus assembly protein TadG